LPGDSKQ
jgi:HSP90 family molecular chaperone